MYYTLFQIKKTQKFHTTINSWRMKKNILKTAAKL